MIFAKKVAKETKDMNRQMSRNVMRYQKRNLCYDQGEYEWTKQECTHIERSTERLNGIRK